MLRQMACGIALGLVCTGAQGAAQAPDASTAEQSPGPCEAAVYRAFDFWLGEWAVHSPDGTLQGHNTITAEEGGCLLVERWTSVQGTTGQSYNFYDPGGEAWRQVWVSGAATIDYSGGLDESGVMRLEGEIAYRGGAVLPFRGQWTPNPDGTVTQSFQQFDPEDGDWKTWFTGIYTRIEGERAG